MASRANDASGRERRERNRDPGRFGRSLSLALSLVLFAAGAEAEPGAGLYAGLQRSVLPNGLQVWVVPRPDSESVALRLMVRTGFRDETPENYGLAHFT